MRNRGQNYLLFCNCVLRKRGRWKENKEKTKRSRGSMCIKHSDSILKNKFAMLRDSAEGQNLSGRF